ncbi:gliding motility-associated C-terminal domain-containing protein [Daejeonella oryzae]|uniref:gliding motility-associated C-terminal domain-containing protein n=1 Tax=Daejeonella oryzae TaxID=1122943 RepID=UPI0003F85DD8|nr:T9SS C-terminal target domain-containing protein [Daejeonella oryzae]
MFKKTLLFLSLCWSFPYISTAQVVNTGALISLESNSLLFIEQDYTHTGGSIINHGLIKIKGNWYNNDAASSVFDLRSETPVELNGAVQTIGGAYKTTFPGLSLTGTGNKMMLTNAEVLSVLSLNDKELAADQFSITVLNSKPEAVTRSTGFVSTGKKGKFIRVTKAAGNYLFPMGSSQNSAVLYRPLVFEAQAATENRYAVTFTKGDPTLSGYNVNNKRQDIQNVFDKYLYVIDQPAGSSNTSIKFHQNSIVDGEFKQLVNWSPFQLWEKAGPSTATDGGFGDNLNRTISFVSTKTIKNTPFTFANTTSDVNDPLSFFNAFSPDGDGKNDKWIVNNLDLFPNNDLTIFNRWGDEVFRTKSYSSSKAWDGGNMNPGTYFYVLNVNIDGTTKSYKGFITMLKKN